MRLDELGPLVSLLLRRRPLRAARQLSLYLAEQALVQLFVWCCTELQRTSKTPHVSRQRENGLTSLGAPSANSLISMPNSHPDNSGDLVNVRTHLLLPLHPNLATFRLEQNIGLIAANMPLMRAIWHASSERTPKLYGSMKSLIGGKVLRSRCPATSAASHSDFSLTQASMGPEVGETKSKRKEYRPIDEVNMPL